ncbi:hypothetical protein [Oceaniglobus trochenteri]|uniref:hypothetical protein n=1 Tax=Oceaniglobus trochenteri TaxID=2763260 RepID=UPI001CFFEAB1|nr:hypothetical protein [Oceaniglobus trochenteri]
MPKPLDIDRLKQFETPARRDATPPATAPDPEPVRAPAERWPSREPQRDGQISIKAPLEVIERFKRICKDDRRTYADMLRILMDNHEFPK